MNVKPQFIVLLVILWLILPMPAYAHGITDSGIFILIVLIIMIITIIVLLSNEKSLKRAIILVFTYIFTVLISFTISGLTIYTLFHINKMSDIAIIYHLLFTLIISTYIIYKIRKSN